MTDERDGYWLVYIFDPETYRWESVGLVEEREAWYDWWAEVQNGDIDLPGRYDGWWASDAFVTFGLPEDMV